MPITRFFVFLASGVFALGCSPSIVKEPCNLLDIRDSLFKAVEKAEPDFPDGIEVKLTHFSYVGSVLTRNEKKIHVIDQRAVITGMSAPRGLNFIVFVDESLNYLGKLAYIGSRPLWCEQSKLFLFGEVDSVHGQGNVIDVSEGFERLSVYAERKYGSLW